MTSLPEGKSPEDVFYSNVMMQLAGLRPTTYEHALYDETLYDETILGFLHGLSIGIMSVAGDQYEGRHADQAFMTLWGEKLGNDLRVEINRLMTQPTDQFQTGYQLGIQEAQEHAQFDRNSGVLGQLIHDRIKGSEGR